VDNPAWDALNGPHAHFAEVNGLAVRYAADVAPFAGFAAEPDARAWDDLAELTGPDQVAVVGPELSAPPGWELRWQDNGLQLVGTEQVGVADDPGIVPLTAADVPEMLDLVELTRPGPFRPRTIELGTYLGIRHGGRLVAMAGERMHPPGYTEISAVCTDPAFRGRGLGGRLVRAVAAGILARGDIPFLHTASSNAEAIRLYGRLGFQVRRRITFSLLAKV
jgi:ribosomal protein S18 acetylase RimI-like enzyme